MRPLLVLLAALAWLAAAPAGADDPAPAGAEAVGKVSAVEGKVQATLGADTRRVERGEAVYRGDWIETEPDARAKVVLNDETQLVVGPGSRIHLDEFVYDSSAGSGKVLVEMGAGLLRFTTGVLDPESYEVKTPVASIGVRGTIFDLIVALINFSTTVILRDDGKLEIRSFGKSVIVDKKGHASRVERADADPTPQRKATEEEEEATEPLKRAFKKELRTRAIVPNAVTKPTPSPQQHHRSSPPSRPNLPRGNY